MFISIVFFMIKASLILPNPDPPERFIESLRSVFSILSDRIAKMFNPAMA